MKSINFDKNIANLLKARFPILYIPTWEEDRLIQNIDNLVSNEISIKTIRKVFVWTSTNGMAGCDGDTACGTAKSVIKALDFSESFQGPAVFLFKDIHHYLGHGRQPDHQVIRRIRDMIPALKNSRYPKSLILISPVLALPVELQKDITVLDFDLPNYEEILAVLNEIVESNSQSGRIQINLDAKEREALAKAALGLTLHEAENAFARSMVEDGVFDISDVDIILQEKQQVIKKTQILEFVNSDLDINDVGGLENLKRWLEKRNKSWLDDAKRYALPNPKGVLITGVPGCGKSLISKAISSMWQLPLLRLDVGRIFGGLVGQSEENIRSAIRTAEAISPSILWIDEIEKGFGGTSSSGDSGTSARVFGTFLTWMQEKEKPVFVIATANNIHALPPEMLRKGRFDEIFFVDLPTRKERFEIFRLHLARRLKNESVLGDLAITDDFIDRLAQQTEGFVGSEIEHVVVAALFEAFSQGRSILSEDFDLAIKNTVPLAITQKEQIQAIRAWANIRAVAATRQEDRAEYEHVDMPSSLSAPPSDDDVSHARGGRSVDF